MKTKTAHTTFADSKMNQMSLLDRANLVEAGFCSSAIPEQIATELIRNRIELRYGSGKLIFGQGSPADAIMWVVKGVVREVCPNLNGTQTLVRLATAGDILGLADKLNEKSQWVRRFEAWTAGPCVLATVTRAHVRNILKAIDPEELLAVSERLNSAATEWIQYYATFLGLPYRERIEMVIVELGRKFGIPDSDGTLLTFEPTHSDLAEMIGCSRPAVGRVLTALIKDGEIGRRGRKYVLLRGGAIEAATKELTRIQNGRRPPCLTPASASRRNVPPRPHHSRAQQF
jgi:CRP/FNR family transcriptional regulator, cyclic AMP receptor protein